MEGNTVTNGGGGGGGVAAVAIVVILILALLVFFFFVLGGVDIFPDRTDVDVGIETPPDGDEPGIESPGQPAPQPGVPGG